MEGSRKFEAWEPVVRWSQLLDAKAGDEVHRAATSQVGVGLDYWIAPSVPVKIAYEFNRDMSNRLLMQWAFGF